MMAKHHTEGQRNREYLDYLARCKQVFAPFAPIDLPEFFAGRADEIERLVQEVESPGRQIAIFGDRGVGKTSLAALAYFFARREEDNCYFVRCTKSSTFDSIFSEALAEAGISVALNGLESTRSGSGAATLGPVDLRRGRETRAVYRALSPPQRVVPRTLLQQFDDREGLIIVDEFDRVQDPDTFTRMAELLKQFSDARSRTKILVVGVAESVTQLVGEHESLTRCLAPLRLDPMSDEELRDLVRRGEDRLGVVFAEPVKHRIVRLADGFPHYAHLVALHAAQNAGNVLLASDDARPVVAEDQYRAGVRLAVENAEARLVEDYERAIITVKRKSEKFELVLGALALSDDREVQVGDIAANATLLTGEPYSNAAFSYHLSELVKPERGTILTRVREGYYKFANPLMRPYIRLRLELDNIKLGGQLVFPFMREERERGSGV